MPDDNEQGNTANQDQQGGGSRQQGNQPKKGGGQGSGLKLMLSGPFEKCSISISANTRPGVAVKFYAGNLGVNTLLAIVADNAGTPLGGALQDGIAIFRDLDLNQFDCLKGLDCITAVMTDGKKSDAVVLPVKTAASVTKTKLLKIVNPDEELYVKRDRNEFPIDILTYTEQNNQKLAGPRQVVITADGPFDFVDGNGTVLASDVTRWQFNTNPDGTHHHVVKPKNYTKRKVKYNVLGDNEIAKLTLEYF
jgi:hypothetical protein